MCSTDIMKELFKAASFSGVLITDGEGMVIYVDDNFKASYGLDADLLLGRSVFDLEEEGYFRPSSAAIVLKTGSEITRIQTLKDGQHVIVSAFPVFDQNKKILKVVTFTRDMGQHIKIKNMYEELMDKVRQYEKTMDELSYESLVIDNFFTNNGSFQKTLKALQSTAKYNINLLLLGETGVGKNLLAKKVHELSDYKDGRFVEVNCGALPENLIESELFGYERGAFTGADQKGKKGLFEVANGGTLFLDEVSELPMQSQAKLLKVLQDSQVRRIGGSQSIKIDCRIISATNKDLSREVEQNRFRQDLLYRLNTVTFTLPPLRERREDIVTLSNSILEKANKKFGLEKMIDKDVMNAFNTYDWPGNVRELENVIYRMVVTSEDQIITKDALPADLMDSLGHGPQQNHTSIYDVSDLQFALDQYEGEIIRHAYLKYGTSIKVAQALNISQATAARKIKKYAIRLINSE